MEKDLQIKVSKKILIYGRFCGSLKKPLFIVVHGIPGHFEESLPQGSARWFAKQGFATFRFNLYDWQKGGRQLMDCTLETHAADLDAVVRYFRDRGVNKIFVAGHSYGGPTVLLSHDQDFDAAVLWDPSYQMSFIHPLVHKRYGYPGGRYVQELRGYLMQWGMNPVIGEKMAQEAETLAWEDLTRNFHRPLKIIAAEKGVLVPGARHYFKTANDPKSFTVMKGATHYFDDQPGMHEKLFTLSKQWSKKFI